jgi:hypothetical protein
MSTLQVNEINDTGGHTLLGRKNAIINGNFDVWQRGTSQTAGGYGSADRWCSSLGTSTISASQQTFTLGQTDVPNNPKYYIRNVVTTGSTSGSYSIIQQYVEGVETFAGETVTLSFYAKADSSKNIAVEFVQFFGTGGSPSISVDSIGVTTVALTSSWAKYTVTADIPSISGKTLGTDGNDSLAVYIWMDGGSDFNSRHNSLGNQSGTFDIAQVQLEKGSVATDFERRSYGEELALCQRYYEVLGTGRQHGLYLSSINRFEGNPFTFAVVKRGTPSMGVLSGTYIWSHPGFNSYSAASNTGLAFAPNTTTFYLYHTRQAGGGTPTGGVIYVNESSTVVYADAEL